MADSTRHSRRISPGLRAHVFQRSNGKCQRPECGTEIDLLTFHVAHLRAASHGGPAVPENLEAWCAPCNLKNGNKDVRDTRVPLRAWQEEALPGVLEALTMKRVATVMAAPGAGKTLFAGTVFARGQDAGLWSRMLVLVPRLPLVKQWCRALVNDCHIGLDHTAMARQSGREMPGMDGVCCTYQSLLSVMTRERHREAVRTTPTLVVLDEVHHLGEPINSHTNTAAWSNAISALVGDLRTQLNVAGVLNLSGTLFRTSPTERISTVEYEDAQGERGEPRIQAITNYAIHPERLVREGLLRAPDLFRVGATVEIVNLKEADVTVGPIADLNDETGRVALRRLNEREEWVSELVKVTLDELQFRYKDSQRSHVKALIVTPRQDMARAFADEVNKQMALRGLQPLAECVVSEDGADAYRRLENFRLKRQVGVLCTVGMAGEGYDCPDIVVVTYATNVLTAQYIRQVVARGQRIAQWEIPKVGHPLTTAIILPDVQDLVEFFTGILAPMVHDIEVPQVPAKAPSEDRARGESATPWSSKDLIAVRDAELEVVTTVSTGGTIDVDPALEEYLPPILSELNLPESLWPRFAGAIDMLNRQRPFDKPILTKSAGATAVIERPAVVQRPLTPREHHDFIRGQLTRARGWWAQIPAKRGSHPVSHVETEIKREIGFKQIEHATPEQLKRAYATWMSRIRRYCDDTGTPLPKWARHRSDDDQ